VTEASTATIHADQEAPSVAVDTPSGNREHRFDLIFKRIDVDLGEHGYPYEVWLGEELIVKSRDPEFAACRKLAKSGRFGRARFWREGKETHDISMDIATAAKWRTKETRRHGPLFVPFEEFPVDRFPAKPGVAIAAGT
jgi:hypothetical protein